MSYTVEVGKNDDDRIYADVKSNGRHRVRLTSTGERPFENNDEAKRAAREWIKRHR